MNTIDFNKHDIDIFINDINDKNTRALWGNYLKLQGDLNSGDYHTFLKKNFILIMQLNRCYLCLIVMGHQHVRD